MTGCVYDRETTIGIAAIEISGEDIKDEKDGYFSHNEKTYFISLTLGGGMTFKTKNREINYILPYIFVHIRMKIIRILM